MAADSSDLCTIAQLKSWLSTFDGGAGGPDISRDDELQRLVTSASAWFRTQIGWGLISASYTDRILWRYQWVLGPPTFRLSIPHVTALAASSPVTIDGNVVPARATLSGPGYVLDGNAVEVYRLHDYLLHYHHEHEVVIVYTAGYSSPPADVVQCVIEVAADMWQRHDRLGQRSRSSAEGGTITFFADDLLPSVKAVVDAYRRVTL